MRTNREHHPATWASPGEVALDYWLAPRHAPGLGRYVRELVHALARLSETPPLDLLELGRGEPSLPTSALGLEGALHLRRKSCAWPRRSFARLAVDGWGRSIWTPRPAAPLKLFHHVLPGQVRVTGAKQVLPVSELPSLNPSDQDSERALTVFRAALAQADRIITFSADTRSQLERDFGVSLERSLHIPVGADHWTRSVAAKSSKSKTATGARNSPVRVLVLGAVRPARASLEIARAFQILCHQGLNAQLVFCGRTRAGDAYADQLAKLCQLSSGNPLASSQAAHEPSIRVIDPVEAEMPALVASSDLLVHLNRSEQTPVTPLEAAQFGLGLLLSKLPAFEEVLGAESSVHWFDPGSCKSGSSEPDSSDVDSAGPMLEQRSQALAPLLAQAIQTCTDSEASQRRRQLAERYTWAGHAQQTLQVWRDLL